MRPSFKDVQHLFSLIVLLLVAISLFVALRAAVVPAGFGKYGHYRAGAIEDNRKHSISFAGQDQCVACHDTQAALRKSGRHANVSCEACHGAQAAHIEDVGNVKPARPDVMPLCLSCHEQDAAKNAKLPQVVRSEHMGGAVCNDCHKPHQPKL